MYIGNFHGSFNVGLLALFGIDFRGVDIDRCFEPSQVLYLSFECQRLICMIL
jgi:hypothetical protein